MLNAISFHEIMKVAVMSGGESSASFNITNGTKQCCVMAPVLFALFFPVMLIYAFGNIQSSINSSIQSTVPQSQNIAMHKYHS